MPNIAIYLIFLFFYASSYIFAANVLTKSGIIQERSPDIILYDNRPENITIKWAIKANGDVVNLEVFRWEFQQDGNILIANFKAKANMQNGRAIFKDDKLNLSNHFRYQLVYSDGKIISPYLFTPPKPILDRINSCELNDRYFIRCTLDTFYFNISSLTSSDFDNFKADSIFAYVDDDSLVLPLMGEYNDFCIIDSTFSMYLSDSAVFKFRSKDAHQISVMSDGICVHKDTTAPTPVNLELKNSIEKDSTKGVINLKWQPALDSGSGLSFYVLKRKLKSEAKYSIIDTLHTTEYKDDFSLIGKSEKVFYRLFGYDCLGNFAKIAEDSVRCLMGPEITTDTSEIDNDSIAIRINMKKFDLTNVERFEVQTNHEGNSITGFYDADSIIRVELPFLGENQIRMRAVFEDNNRKSIWSNTITVKKSQCQITSVTVDHDIRDSTKQEGNFYLHWTNNGNKNCKFDIWRIFTEEGDTIKIKDNYSNNFYYDEYHFNNFKIFGEYEYIVYPAGKKSRGASDRNYCNRAPIIEQAPAYARDTIQISMSQEWKNNLAENVNEIKILYVIRSNAITDTMDWREYSQYVSIPIETSNSFHNGDTLEVHAIARANDTLYSEESLAKKVILDLQPPSGEKGVELVSEFFADSLDGNFRLTWHRFADSLSGLKRYQIERKIGEGNSWEIIEKSPYFTDTVYADVFSQIGESENIFYRISAFDHVGNSEKIGQVKGRCLLGPEISVKADTTFMDSIEVAFKDYNMENVYGFEIIVNQNRYIKSDTNSSSFVVPLDTGENKIRARALFNNVNHEDSLVSIWSKMVTVYRFPIPEVTSVFVQHDSNNSSSYKGNLVISWIGKNLSGCSFDIYRNISGDSNSIKIVSNLTEKLYADSSDVLPFYFYTYTIVPITKNGIRGKEKSGENYCNKSPALDNFDANFISDTINICIDREWIDEVPSGLESSLKFRLKIATNEQQDTTDWQDMSENCYQIALQNLFDNLSQFNATTFKFYAQAKANDTLFSAWSLPISTILDVKPPMISGSFEVKPVVNSDYTNGWMEISWNEAIDSLSGLKNYQLWRKIGEDNAFTLIQGAENLTCTAFIDSFSAIRKSKIIYYKLKVFDNVDNWAEIYSSGTRCLLGPDISVWADSTFKDSVILNWNRYDLTNIKNFIVNLSHNYENDSTFQIESDTSKAIPLPFEGENILKVRSLFNDGLSSTWSNSETVVHMRNSTICSVRVEHDTCFSTMHEGNLIVRWFPEKSVEGQTFKIYRRKVNDADSVLIDTVNDTNVYSDKFADYIENDPNRLVPFQEYEYIVYPVNPDGSLGKGASGMNYCNRAPIVNRCWYIPKGEGINSNYLFGEIIPQVSPYPISQREFTIFFFDNFIPSSLADTAQKRIRYSKIDTSNSSQKIYFKYSVKEPFTNTIAASVIQRINKNDGASLYSSFSETKSDSNLAIPKIETANMIDLPGSTAIVLDWSQYSDPRINNFRLMKREINAGNETIIETKEKHYVDSNVKSDQEYHYEIIPGINFVFNNSNSSVYFNDKSFNDKVYNDTGRVYVPVVDLSNFVKNRYFKNDTITVKWFWMDRNGSRIEDSCDFRGANKLLVTLANNVNFYETTGTNKSITKEIILDAKKQYPSNHEIQFSDLEIKLNATHGSKIYLKITATNPWEDDNSITKYNRSTYWDSVMWNDSLAVLIRDEFSPPPVDDFKFTTRAADTCVPNLIDILLMWEGKRGDETSGICSYKIKMDYKDQNLSDKEIQIYDTTFFPCGKFHYLNKNYSVYTDCDNNMNTFKMSNFSVRKNDSTDYQDQDIKFLISISDYVGNERKYESNDVAFFVRYPPPEIISIDTSIDKKSPVDTVKIIWDPPDKEGVKKYIVQSAFGKRDALGKPSICRSDTVNTTSAIIPLGWNHGPQLESSGEKDSSFFHVAAIYDGDNESCWSKVAVWSKEGSFISLEKQLAAKEIDENKKLNYELYQNYPNPFNSVTYFSFELKDFSYVILEIYNIHGELVISLLKKDMPKGKYTVPWNGKDMYGNSVSCGLYIYKIQTKKFRKMKKCILLK